MDIKEQILVALGLNKAEEEIKLAWQSKSEDGGTIFVSTSTTNTFKETVKDVPGATWSSGGNLNTARSWGGHLSINRRWHNNPFTYRNLQDRRWRIFQS